MKNTTKYLIKSLTQQESEEYMKGKRIAKVRKMAEMNRMKQYEHSKSRSVQVFKSIMLTRMMPKRGLSRSMSEHKVD